MKLNNALVEQLASIKAQKAELSRQEERLVPKIKAKMEAKGIEEFAPDTCPYKLVLNKFAKSHVSWKSEWATLAKKFLGKKWKKVQTKMVEDSKEEETQLCVEPNPKYKGESD
jgi:hypothetical protein